MNFLRCMNDSIAYIEEHLEDKIDLEEVARIACCSVYHYQRLFYCLTNMTVGEYIRKRRLSEAALYLQQSNVKIIDLALKYQYSSPAAFTRAFTGLHGNTPNKAKKKGTNLKLFSRISFQITIKGENVMNYRIEEKEAFRVIGIKEKISTAGGQNFVQVPKFWQRACANGQYEEVIARRMIGSNVVYGICTNFGAESFEYYIAVRNDKEMDKKIEELIIPASKWVVFTCDKLEEIQQTFKRLYSEWFPSSGYEHAGTPEVECYYDEGERNKYEVWIPITKKSEYVCGK